MRRFVIRKSKTIRSKIYDHLREQILSGEIPPHQHLIEAKIAEQIRASRTPVREALHSLELEGLVESIPRVGYVVKPLSEAEVDEICEIRRVIEALAARWAMEKAHKKLVQELKKNIALSETLISRGEIKAFVEIDAQFHETIARLSESQRLLELSQTLRRHMLRYRTQSIYSADNVLRAIHYHRAILQAIEKGDFEEVKAAIKNHLEQVRTAILTYAFKEGPPGNKVAAATIRDRR